MSITPRGMTVTEAYRAYRSGNLLVNRKYQRKLIWTVEEKEKLISSILKGYPIPLILLAERPQIHGSGKYEIIDGMQRLDAICSFIENSFTFENKYFDLEEFSFARKLANDQVFKAADKNSSRLSPQECADLLDYQFAVTIYTAMEEEEITEVFDRVNSNGKHLSNQERRQAGVTTPFAEIVRSISMQLRGDDSKKILRLADMPAISISIKSKKYNLDYGIKAEETMWCKQGILTPRELRESEDEDMIADIAASILLNKPLNRSKETLDALYDPKKKYNKDIELSSSPSKLDELEKNIVKTFSVIRSTIESYSTDKKCLSKIINPRSNNPIPQAFYTIFMAFYDLIVNQELMPTDSQSIMTSLENLQSNLDLSNRYTKVKDRENNIKRTKGLIQEYFAKKDTSNLGQGIELLQQLENSLRRSRIETARYECKQGLLDLDKDRPLNKKLLPRLVETICGIANLGSDTDGYIFLGVADEESHANRIKSLDKINPVEINGRYIVGVDREARIQGKKLEQYIQVLKDTITNSGLTEPLKTQVLTKFDVISYRDLSVVRIVIPAQKEVSFIGDQAFTRKHSSTEEVKGKELLAISQLFTN